MDPVIITSPRTVVSARHRFCTDQRYPRFCVSHCWDRLLARSIVKVSNASSSSTRAARNLGSAREVLRGVNQHSNDYEYFGIKALDQRRLPPFQLPLPYRIFRVCRLNAVQSSGRCSVRGARHGQTNTFDSKCMWKTIVDWSEVRLETGRYPGLNSVYDG